MHSVIPGLVPGIPLAAAEALAEEGPIGGPILRLKGG
jgi:hypothetical protein